MTDFVSLLRGNGRQISNVLDLGCGTCEEGQQILDAGMALTGVDQDSETIEKVRQKFPSGRFIAANAALWLSNRTEKYDAVLIRRPDVIFQNRNWKQVFAALPGVLHPDSIVLVTAPGCSEAEICQKWLAETAEKTELIHTGRKDEAYMATAEKIRKTEPVQTIQDSLIRDLSWEDENRRMVCDLLTGKCTVIDETEEERKEADAAE